MKHRLLELCHRLIDCRTCDGAGFVLHDVDEEEIRRCPACDGGACWWSRARAFPL